MNDEIQMGNTKGGGGFFSFRKMVSPILIKIIYSVGLIGITLYGFYAIFGNTTAQMKVIGLLSILLGNLFWRILCEGWILLFSIHDILGSIEKKLK